MVYIHCRSFLANNNYYIKIPYLNQIKRRDNLKAIIFDMDGVIIDSEPLHLELEKKLLEELGGKITPEELQDFVGTTDYYMWSTFKNKFNIKNSIEEMIAMKKKDSFKIFIKLALLIILKNLC